MQLWCNRKMKKYLFNHFKRRITYSNSIMMGDIRVSVVGPFDLKCIWSYIQNKYHQHCQSLMRPTFSIRMDHRKINYFIMVYRLALLLQLACASDSFYKQTRSKKHLLTFLRKNVRPLESRRAHVHAVRTVIKPRWLVLIDNLPRFERPTLSDAHSRFSMLLRRACCIASLAPTVPTYNGVRRAYTCDCTV